MRFLKWSAPYVPYPHLLSPLSVLQQYVRERRNESYSESSFTKANLSNLGEEMLEVILTNERTILHTLLVNNIATNGKLAYDIGCPLSKLGALNELTR